jgi:hypothetical protein
VTRSNNQRTYSIQQMVGLKKLLGILGFVKPEKKNKKGSFLKK